MARGADEPTVSGPAAVSRWQAWGMLALLFLASIVSVIDRTILNVVVDSVKADLRITDVQISLLQGIAFGLFYATMGVWLGLVADRIARRNLIIVGISVWSLSTVLGGLAHSFGMLFACRMAVGLGEAALSPAAISLIADLFPPGQRGRPIGIFLMGQALANGVSISVTGALLGAASHGQMHALPLIGGLTPWRIVFVICGLGGLIVSAAFFLTREPPRERATAAGNLRIQAVQALTYIFRERRQYFGVYAGFAIFFLGAYGAGVWQVVMVSRQFGISASKVAALFGPLAIGFGVAGPFIGGTLVDWIVRRTNTHGLLWLLALVPFCALPSASAVFAPNIFVATMLCATQSGVSALVGSSVLAYLQSTMPPEMRGFSVSLTGLLNSVIGLAVGPMLVALLTEKVFGDPKMVGWGIFFVAGPAYLAAALLFALTALGNRHHIRSRAPSTEALAHG